MYAGKLKKVVFVINSQKNLIKISPVIDSFARYYDSLEPILLYTGRPFPKNLAIYLFDQLGLPRPNIYFNVKPGPHTENIAGVMYEAERCFPELAPDLIVVIGGSSAALGASIIAARLGIRIAHIEAGLRCPGNISSTDINRKLVDSISDMFFVTDGIAHSNVFSEGIAEDRISFVGNIMVDALHKFLPFSVDSQVLDKLGLTPKRYAVLSLHRLSNTANYDIMKGIISAARQLAQQVPIVCACYRRVKNEIEEFGLQDYFDDRRFIRYTVSKYPDFLALEKNASFVLTDSGTMQVESSALGIPCLTLRKNTEWIVTVTEGTNKIVGPFPEKIIAGAEMILANESQPLGVPKYWDGHSALRIAEIIAKSIPYEDPSTRKIKTITISE